MGTWKITAHYEDDEANAASREFKVQKFGKLVNLSILLLVLHIISCPSQNIFIVTQFYQVLK